MYKHRDAGCDTCDLLMTFFECMRKWDVYEEPKKCKCGRKPKSRQYPWAYDRYDEEDED